MGVRSRAGSKGMVYSALLTASGAKLPKPMVYPSGFAVAICPVPMLPLAPGLLSTTTGTPSESLSFCASWRERVSELPPAA
ncbi:hypothetical protein D3C72_1415220 [compost metagenome]